jgi:chromosome segregation ATPase
MDESQAELIGERLAHFRTTINDRFERSEARLAHVHELTGQQLARLEQDLERLQKSLEDHEARLRRLDDEVIALKSLGSLVQAGQAVLTLLAASLAAWLGSR